MKFPLGNIHYRKKIIETTSQARNKMIKAQVSFYLLGPKKKKKDILYKLKLI